MKILNIAAIAALSSLILISCKRETKDDPDPTPKDEYGILKLKFDHRWGPNLEAFQMNQTYTHPATQAEIKFTTLRYYISNIELLKADGSTWKEEESYHIVDAGQAINYHIDLENVPAGDYVGVRFLVGVDSLRNTSGAQEGALSPSEGMFWSWTTGYIFIKAEGESPDASNGNFSYHIGGFTGEHNAIRQLNLLFGGDISMVSPNAAPSIHLKINCARFWHGGLSFADYHVIHMPGAKAATLADNFAGAIVYDHLHN